MILVTTSRKPSTNTRIFARRLANVIPNSLYVNRGKQSVDELAGLAVSKGLVKIAVIGDNKGNPGKIEFIKSHRDGWDWETPMAVKGVFSTPNKKQFTEVSVKSKKLAELFALENVSDAELKAEVKDSVIEFHYNKECILRIKEE